LKKALDFEAGASKFALCEHFRIFCSLVNSPMRKAPLPALSRRESQIMEILHRLERATAAEVQAELPDPPGYSSVRKLLEILEKKGEVQHEQDGPRYVFFPSTIKTEARRSALEQLIRTFFGGSVEETAVALLSMSERKLSPEVLKRIAAEAERASKKGR
jgi:BlaI family transcriptional regulator, penicillinase repressor